MVILDAGMREVELQDYVKQAVELHVLCPWQLRQHILHDLIRHRWTFERTENVQRSKEHRGLSDANVRSSLEH